MKKKLKEFLPYLIIIGIAYLIVPALLFINSDAVSYIILIGVLPLTAVLCCARFSVKKRNDFLLSLAAPVFFLPAMFVYPIARQSLIKALIYLVAYFLCGYLGLTIGDILANRVKDSKGGRDRAASRRAEREAEMDEEPVTPENRPASTPVARRVDVKVTPPADPYYDSSLDTSTTEDDIDAILREIHQRRSGE